MKGEECVFMTSFHYMYSIQCTLHLHITIYPNVQYSYDRQKIYKTF